MAEIEEHLCKVETKDDHFYVLFRKARQGMDEFELDITDGLAVWSTRVTDELLQNMATKVEMDVKDYTMQTLKALTCQSSMNDCFIYQAIKKNSMLEFNWKKQLVDGVKYQLGSISLPLNKENKEFMQSILNVAIRKIHEYKDNAMFMKSENEQLAKDRDHAIARLEKCVVSKEEMELGLFQKFVTVLNDKKAKIRRLQEDSSISTDGRERDNEKKIPKRDDDDDTDTETDQPQRFQRSTFTASQPRVPPLPPTSEEEPLAPRSNEKLMMDNEGATTSSNIGSSLFKDEEDTGPVVKRRRKNKSKLPSNTPSKSVLPEVKTTVNRTISNASSNSTTSNESRQSGSLTRRSSRRNKGSSTFPDDVEDLFGDMA